MTRYLISLVLLTCASTIHAGTLYNITASAGVAYDDNLTRAQYSRDFYNDRSVFAGISTSYNLPLSQHSFAQFVATIETRQYRDANLGENILSIHAEYSIQPEHGYTAPWFGAYLLYGVNQNDSDYRDGHFYELGANFGKRLTDAMEIRAGLNQHETTTGSSIFSLRTTKLYGNFDFRFGLNTLYMTLSYTSGDVLSTNTPPHPSSLNGVPWVNDDDAFSGLTNSWTYKLDADTWSFRLGYIFAITSNQSLDTNIMKYSSSAYGGNDYDGMISTLTYLYQF